MTTEDSWRLLQAFREGRSGAGDVLLRAYEPWLRFLAEGQVQSRFRAKVGCDDVVQQAMVEAVRGAGAFRGGTRAEFAAWLRGILAHVLAREYRRYAGTQKRDLAREVAWEQELDQSAGRLGDLVPGGAGSPAEEAMREERACAVARVLTRLPEDYRTVIRLRHFEGLSHDEVAARMERPAGAVRMLWVRALARLKEEADADPDLRSAM